MTDLIKLLEDCVHPIRLINEGNHCEKDLLERIEVAINELKQVKNLAIHDVVVPKGTLPKDIDFVSKESWELFDKHYDNETSNKHTKHWNFMEGIRTALKEYPDAEIQVSR